jgi:hypothetical protein
MDKMVDDQVGDAPSRKIRTFWEPEKDQTLFSTNVSQNLCTYMTCSAVCGVVLY